MIRNFDDQGAEGGGAPAKTVFKAKVADEVVSFPTSKPTGMEILASVGLRPCSHFVVQIVRNADDQTIDPSEHADLSLPGVERFAIVARDVVTISINQRHFELQRGHHPVAELKRLGGVPAEDKLSQDVDGWLKDLPDDSVVEIKGCEVFDSRKPAGGSS